MALMNLQLNFWRVAVLFISITASLGGGLVIYYTTFSGVRLGESRPSMVELENRLVALETDVGTQKDALRDALQRLVVSSGQMAVSSQLASFASDLEDVKGQVEDFGSILQLEPTDILTVVRLGDQVDSMKVREQELQTDIQKLSETINELSALLEERIADVNGGIRNMLLTMPVIILGLLGIIFTVVRMMMRQPQ